MSCLCDAGDHEVIDGDDWENTDNSSDDDDDDDGDNSERDKVDDDKNDESDSIQPAGADGGDDADDSNDAEFNAAHQPLQGSFKTAEGITVTIVKGSVAAQKVCTCDKTVERSVQIYIPYERTFSLVFREEEWLVGATPST